jgi:hypothetical protein
MYYHRILWITSGKAKITSAGTKAQFEAAQPSEIRWKADNYNHLFEQPTQFYAVALTLALLGANSKMDLMLAWGYVGMRVVHSFVHSCGNHIPTRFKLFVVNSVVLAALTVRAGAMIWENI